mmetsp:Transcript_1071/g.122  ORF Transcript_1071/g.122 Transcript_1071/m.122 type:complete len:91 (+) Transcript_1071:2968-3240(+)
MILLFISNTAFAIIYYIRQSSPQGSDIFLAIEHSYRLNYGEFPENSDTVDIIIFYVQTIANPLILMNLLIAIMGDTYSRAQETMIASDSN